VERVAAVEAVNSMTGKPTQKTKESR